MIETATRTEAHDIVVDEIFPNSAEAIWKALTTGPLMARWLMEPTGFEPVEGNRFTYRTTPAGKWDGVIQCEVLTVIPNQRLAYSWTGGDAANAGYGSRLETIVTFDLFRVDGGTRLRLTHAGFKLPHNQSAYTSMSKGWRSVVRNISEVAAELS